MHSTATYERESEVACAAARSAGRAAMKFYGDAAHSLKDGGSPVTAADHASNAVILDAIAAAFPEDAILSEETADTPKRLTSRRVWIIDPLDGTKEFLSQNGEFSVMIALLENGALKVAAVYRPVDDVLYHATAGGGAWRSAGDQNTRLVCTAPGDNVRVVGSRSHADPLVAALCEMNGFTDIEPCGSVGLKCTRIAEGARDLYVHPVPYMGEWDTAAPELILAEAGGLVVDCYGQALRYNKPIPKQPEGIFAAHPDLAERVLPMLADLQNAKQPAITR